MSATGVAASKSSRSSASDTLLHSQRAAIADGRANAGRDSALPPVSVVLPAYNEEAAVRIQVEAIRAVLTMHRLQHELIVVDDGSTDNTFEEALRARARVVRHTSNRGYGAAIKSGMLAALYDTIVISDADGTYPAEEIPALVAKLASADMVVGTRTGEHVHIPWIRRPAKWCVGWLAVRVAGKPISDLNSGLRAFRRDCLKQYFPILSNRFSFTTTSTLALLADEYEVLYHPIDYHRRIGTSKITPRHFMDFLMLIMRISMMFQPLRIFLPLALGCAGLGILKTLFDLFALFQRHPSVGWYLAYQPVLSTSATLLLVTGLQLLFIGMLAEALVRRIAQLNGPLVPSRGTRIAEITSDAEADVSA
jgi:glycosyltransferase involved in cell wall biosynthesis